MVLSRRSPYARLPIVSQSHGRGPGRAWPFVILSIVAESVTPCWSLIWAPRLVVVVVVSTSETTSVAMDVMLWMCDAYLFL